MLCARCHEREAIVHITRVDAPAGEMTKHDFCESCARQLDEGASIPPLPQFRGGWTSYSVPLPPRRPNEKPSQVLKVLDLEWEAQTAATLAELGKPFGESHRRGLCDSGLRWAFHYADWCLGWIWRQWLMGTPHEAIQDRVGPFVERGLRLRKEAHDYEKLPHHDLLLLHCAIFASEAAQLKEVVETVSDASGDKGTQPADVGSQFSVSCGELYAAAWCGMMKHAILGDAAKAAEQYGLIWKAKRDQELIAAPKALTNAWLKQDWKAFVIQQKKDFDKLWTRARRHRGYVKSETPSEVVVTTAGYRIRHMWCWSHCGMALLAHRKGIEVATDPLWFPLHALDGV